MKVLKNDPITGELVEIEMSEEEFAASLPAPTEEEIKLLLKIKENQKKAAFRQEADPLFFKAQRGEATMEEWHAKVAEIRARFADPA